MTARVLVVDDLVPNLKLLEARLTAEYFDVVTATNGFEALEICERDECDIVLLDVMMPGMDGFEVCRRLKSNPETLHLPVVMVTALDQTADRVRGLEAGADDFLTKPIDEIALIARVRSLARLKFVMDELRNRAETSASLGVSDAIAPCARRRRGRPRPAGRGPAQFGPARSVGLARPLSGRHRERSPSSPVHRRRARL